MKTSFSTLLLILLSSLCLPAQNNRTFYHSRIFGEFDYQHGFLFACSSSLGSHTPFDAIHLIGGYFLDSRLSVGIGIGVESLYSIPTPESALTVPVLADVKGYLFNKSKTPFAFVTVGKSFQFNENSASFQIEPGVGYNWSFAKRFALHATLSYKLKYYNDITFYGNCFPDNVERSLPITFHFMSLGIGISF